LTTRDEVGIISPATKSKRKGKTMFTVNKLDCSDGLSLGRQWIVSEMEDAITIGVNVVLDGNPDLRISDVRSDLELGQWISEDGESGVFIGQAEN
jgi:hypothetical protein